MDEDLGECFQNLFLKETIIVNNHFTKSRNNRGIIVNNFTYYFKSESKNLDKRWVCNNPKFSSSITTRQDEIIKINGKLD